MQPGEFGGAGQPDPGGYVGGLLYPPGTIQNYFPSRLVLTGAATSLTNPSNNPRSMGRVKMPKALTQSGRTAEAKTGVAMPDGSYPIPDVAYLHKAIRAVGRSHDIAATKAHIKRRAAALGASSLIPPTWK